MQDFRFFVFNFLRYIQRALGRFNFLACQHPAMEYLFDGQRRRGLVSHGFVFGRAFGAENNCCVDELLQLLVAYWYLLGDCTDVV